MKKVFIVLLLITLGSVKKIQAQVPDTLIYLQSIVANKSNYIGQPFSVLKNNLQIEIKYFFPFAAIHYNKNIETSTSFAFYFAQTTNEYYLSYPRLKVTWQVPLNIALSDIIRATNNNKGQWNSSAESLYYNAIIKDIQIRE